MSELLELKMALEKEHLRHVMRDGKVECAVLGGDLFMVYEKPNGLCMEHIWRYSRDGIIRERMSILDILREVRNATRKEKRLYGR